MIEVPYFVKDHLKREFMNGDVKVTIHDSKSHIKSGLTFKKDGYWHGLEKKIHIYDYLAKLITYGKDIDMILINDVDLSRIEVLALPPIIQDKNNED
jgi:hypothetical protein